MKDEETEIQKDWTVAKVMYLESRGAKEANYPELPDSLKCPNGSPSQF